jgi:hypothetical protein
MDCTGLEAIIDELTAARRLGRIIEVDRPVSPPVKRVITFMDVSAILWPPEPDAARPPLRVIDGAAEGRREPLPARREPEAHDLALVAGDSGPERRAPGAPGTAER